MITPQLDLSNDMNYQHVLRDPAPTIPQSEDAQSILYTPFISAILSATVLLIHYYIHDLDLRRSLSSGTVRKKPLANTAPSGARRPINIWKAFRLGVCLMLLLLAIVMLGMADSCHNLDSKPDGKVGKVVRVLVGHGLSKHKKHQRHTSLCLTKEQSTRLALACFYVRPVTHPIDKESYLL
jgi:hypothetical protein